MPTYEETRKKINVMPLTLQSLIERQAKENPAAPAIMAPGRTAMSYGALEEQLATIGNGLTAAGIRRADRVAVVVPNGPEAATAVLGVACQAACAPLNPGYAKPEYEYYLSDLDARALVVQDGFDSAAREVAHRLGIAVIELQPLAQTSAGSFRLTFDQVAGISQVGTAEAGDIALVLHTSGTTARPKIVPLTHRNLCASAANIADSLQLGAGDRCLNIMPVFHIHGIVASLLASLAAGQSVICTGGLEVEHFFRWIEESDPTWYTAVPTMHRSVVVHARGHRQRARDAGLRFIRSSSSALPPSLMAELEATFGCPVIEAYGMTEAAHQIASNPLPPKARKAGSVGLPAGPDVAVTEDTGEMAGPGIVGELVIRGSNVTSGYQGIESNEDVYRNGWFRTGDQGLIDEDGYILITGRIKEIINRGGESLSPREIDEALLEHPDIEEAVAFAVPHPTLGEDVAAAVVLGDGSALGEKDIRQYAFSRLAESKVPSQVILVDEIPRAGTGKVQRAGLAAQFEHLLRRPYVAPRDDIELITSELWSEILDRDEVGIEDNFFALGGDSLLGMRVTARLRAIFDIDMLVSDLFTSPTVAKLGAQIRTGVDPARLAEISRAMSGLTDEPGLDSPEAGEEMGS
jgi:acyl-CoA synthetase (AMP-forming)/AMP-acid ligase II